MNWCELGNGNHWAHGAVVAYEICQVGNMFILYLDSERLGIVELSRHKAVDAAKQEAERCNGIVARDVVKFSLFS